jgi:hypothetical protein
MTATKFYGIVGYAVTEEVLPGKYKEVITNKNYRGDVTRVSRRLQTADKVNDDIRINNEIRIVADAFAYQNFQNIRYVEWMGTKWKVESATVDRPRIVLEIGGEYNGSSGPSVTT